MSFLNFEKYWQSFGIFSIIFYPFSLVYQSLAWARRLCFQFHIFKTHKFDIPIIVIGNITAGGTGKTPLVIWLANYCLNQGLRVGIVARGYKGKAHNWPQQVRPDSDPISVGDEAILLASRTKCPVCVSPNRVEAVNALIKHHECDLIISDDGMQHYFMERDFEIAVIDGVRRFGNRQFIPAGPLREPLSRLNEVDLLVVNGESKFKELTYKQLEVEVISLCGRYIKKLSDFKGRQVIAIAGVGNPRTFFDTLLKNNLIVEEHAFPDHHSFKNDDLSFHNKAPILMTEKDAVKCKRFFKDKEAWVVVQNIQPDDNFIHRINTFLEKHINIE